MTQPTGGSQNEPNNPDPNNSDPNGGEGNTGTGEGNGPPANAGGNSLDDILAKLDEEGRKAVRDELKRARDDAAKYRTRASKFGDIDPDRAREALTKLDEIEAANKSEAQKAADKAAAAEQERDTARKELWRERVGRKHKLSDVFTAMVQGNTEEEMDEHAKAISAELESNGKRPADAVPATPKSNHSPGAGESEEFDPEKVAERALSSMR